MSGIIKHAHTSQIAEALLELKGKPLSFSRYAPFRTIYDMDPDTAVLKAGRQIGKSVSLAGRIITKSIGRRYFNSLYIAPFQVQAKRFSNAYLDAFVESPIIKKHFKTRSDVNNVYEKSFSTGSRVYLSYAENEADADRIRGIMADQLVADEVQDISMDAFVPIVEILSASEYKFKVFAGTSKSTANTLERLWMSTNQMEWAMKCTHCNKWVLPNSYSRCIAICSNPLGPSCYHCGKVIDVCQGQWVAANTSVKNKIGFHLPQFIMASNTTAKNWPGIIDKVLQAQNGGMYSPNTLANEVFGLATDLSGKSLSAREAQLCCNEERTEWIKDRTEAAHKLGVYKISVGVDWSVTGSNKSFTVISVVGFSHDGKTHLLYSEIIQGTHILSQVDRVRQLYLKYEADIISGDRGVGVLQGQLLQQSLGYKNVIMVNYVAAKRRLRWDSAGGFMAADRTMAMDIIMQKMRHGKDKFETPCWNLTQHMWEHALAIFEEEMLTGRRVYRHEEDKPDDWFHSISFAYVGLEYLTGQYSFVE